MGQYFHPVNLDKREYVNSHDYGSGLKLMEHSWLLNPFVNAVLHLLKPGERWHQTRLVWAGDYMDDGLFLKQIEGKGPGVKTLYDCCNEPENGDAPCISKLIPVLPDGPATRYIVNHERMQFIDLQKLPEENEGWVIHPLPLLTCSGNGRGGGDFRGDNKYVGSWAGQVISAEYERPLGFKEIKPDFTERQDTKKPDSEHNSFSPQRLEHIRRLRKARRLFKQVPLFAFNLMKGEYPNYTYSTFLDDLRRRAKPKPKLKKDPLSKYGRFHRMQLYINQYQETGDYMFLIKAQALRRLLTKPYRIMVRLNGTEYTYKVSALIPIEKIESIMPQIQKCTQPEAVDTIIDSITGSGF